MSRSTLAAVLMVDGYNAIGNWPALVRIRDRSGLEAARRDLTEALIGYSAFQGMQTQVVFDAQYRASPGSCEALAQSLSVCYTHPGQTADTYIEKACARWCHSVARSQHRLIVATSDQAQRLTVVGYGAEWMSAQQLVRDVEATTLRIKRKQRSRQRPKSRFLAHSLDREVAEQLAKFRQGL